MPVKVFIFDTTLRDGEQSPGSALNVEEKVQIAHHLAKLNVDVIEAGFPVSSPGDFEAVSRIAAEVEGPEICGLARALPNDIRKCWGAIQHSKKPRIHTFVGTSDIHIEGILRKNREEVLKMAVDSVIYARTFCETVEFSAMDATRTDRGYLYEVIAATIEAGVGIINIPDTVGYALPEQFGKLISDIRANVKNIDRVVLSVHCHNDLGMAVANSLAAVKNGAQQIECTINGLGERAGNASLEEIVMAIQTRKDFFDALQIDINTKEIYPVSKLVGRLMGIAVPPNKAIVGANAFSHSSGIHQDGVIKRRETFEIMNPDDIGITDIKRLPLTAHSGRKGLKLRLLELGYEVDDIQFPKVYKRFIGVADKKKEVQDADLEAIIQDEMRLVPDIYILECMQVLSGSHTIPTATVRLKRNSEIKQEAATGDGPVDAVYKAIDRITGVTTELVEYNIQAVTHGKDAIGEVTVKIRGNGEQIFVGHGASTDIIEASGKAYVTAINKLLYVRPGGGLKE